MPPRRACVHLACNPQQVGVRQMAFPDEAMCPGCLVSDLRDELIRCHCCGAELTDQVTAMVLLPHGCFLRTVASLCEVCKSWLPPAVQPLRWGPISGSAGS